MTRTASTAGLLLGAALGFLGTLMPWWSGPAAPAGTAVATKPALQSLGAVLTGVLAAGWLLSLTLGPRAKQVVGVLLVPLALGLGATAFGSRGTPPGLATEPTLWPWLVLPGGVLAAAGAVAMVAGAPTWERRADRFDRSVPTDVGPDADAVDLWKAMDAGVDPTATPATDTPGEGATSGEPGPDGPK